MSKIPKFEFTEIEHIAPACKQVRNTFLSHKTRPLEWRLIQLRKLYWGLKDNMDLIMEACKLDIGKSNYETYLVEVGWCMNDIVHVSDNLHKWAKDEKPDDIDLVNSFMSPKIRKDPLGTVLVIGAYNFPFQLSLGPMIGAIAAGNSVILKPSENAPNAGAVMEMIVNKYLDTSAFKVIQGGIPETTALLEEKWDKIFYTGGGVVGKIISRKAADNLTPVVLELGGKNPAIVTKNADARLAARRLYWAKVHNAGQVCVSQNYILVDKEILPAFIQELKNVQKEFFPAGVKNSPDYGRIINNRQWTRLKKMLDESKGKIIMGGTMDEADNFLEPTVVQVSDVNDSLLQDESFGPLIPILPVDDLDQAIRIATEIDPTPLGCYPFGTKAETDKVLSQIRSGGATVNDGYFHASIPTLQFGGVGQSGTGSYRGRASFECFSHRRSIASTPNWLEMTLAVRYPPYKGKMNAYKKMSELKPDFDRHGNKKFAPIKLLMSLIADHKKGGLLILILAILLKARGGSA